VKFGVALASLFCVRVVGAWLVPPPPARGPSPRRRALEDSTSSSSSSLAAKEEVPPELLRKVEAYLASRSKSTIRKKREALVARREAAMRNPVWRAGNYLFSLESLLPAIPKDLDDDEEFDPLDYAEMARCGYQGLVQEVMDVGGRGVVSRALGLTLRPRKTKPPPRKLADDLVKTPERVLSLGASRDARVEAIAAANFTELAEQKRQRKLAEEEAKRRERARRLANAKPVPAPRAPRPKYVPEEEVPVTDWPLALAPFGLGTPARVYASFWFLALAVSSGGRATTELVDKLGSDSGFLLFDALHDLSAALLAANVAAAALAAFQTTQLLVGKSGALEEPSSRLVARAAFRALVGGPLAALETKRQLLLRLNDDSGGAETTTPSEAEKERRP